MFSSAEWHTRFRQQARWTYDLRRYLFQRAGLSQAHKILDIGCGTGALMDDLLDSTPASVYGLDINPSHLSVSMRKSPRPRLIQADAHNLPFPNGTFDLIFCHFLLLWVSNPQQVVKEMQRVSSPGGTVLALAEPDYGGRIDYPPALAQIGQWQAAALQQQGADPFVGRKLSTIFHTAGLEQIETGVLGGQWHTAPSAEEWQSEWAMLTADLAHNPTWASELEQLKSTDQMAWQNGSRVLFVPTFYALGRAPK